MSFDADIFIDNGTCSQRRVLEINSCVLSDEHQSAIIGLHEFSGNDYPDSFGREWQHAGKKMCKKADYAATFLSLGSTYLVYTEITQGTEKYVCTLYDSSKLHSVNETRSSIFWDKYNKDKKLLNFVCFPRVLAIWNCN